MEANVFKSNHKLVYIRTCLIVNTSSLTKVIFLTQGKVHSNVSYLEIPLHCLATYLTKTTEGSINYHGWEPQ